MNLTFEELTRENFPDACKIDRTDISETFVDNATTIMETTEYGLEHHCIGHTFLIRYNRTPVALVLLGEAIPWETDPPEMKKEPFYRLMGFVVDKNHRNLGLGSEILEQTIKRVYQDFGKRPIALGCHKDNVKAEQFYLRHGFIKTDYLEGNDYYYLRFIE